ncbi:MAG: two-component system NtrC family C4-dicarboxylate transport sensor histidine kinase DctB [Gallionellaceae bacterium]|nr:MAG: two-component system NtrC family C4-dicarboxylate transport sensor histidine kinase DctB [Gallionellaceae bacterium]
MSKPIKLDMRWIAAIAIITAAALAGYAVAMRNGHERLRNAAEHRLDMVGVGLENDLARYEYLPSLLEMMPGVFALLADTGNPVLRDEVNRYLQGINATAGASNLYVLNRTGIALAASDWNVPGTPVGTDLSFRPYVKEALAHGRGRFYGVGITSKRAGYFLSYALPRQGPQRGVATVKVNLEEAEAAWKKLPGTVLLVDERGVVILSSREEWKFRPLSALAAPVLADIASTRPYGAATLRPLDWRVMKNPFGNQTLVSVDGIGYLTSERALRQSNWHLLVLDEVAPVRTDARYSAITAALGTSVLLLLAMVLWQRQRAIHHQLASRTALQAAHDSLEAKVATRTTELRSTVELLGDEVEARKVIEADLRATQNDLLHAGKMAALGQMSAGVVHELNQPLGALRTLSDNACVLLEQDRLGDVRNNLQRIAHLVDRLGRLTHQLKAFAYKTSPVRVPAALQQVIANAQFLVSQRLRDNGIELVVQVQPADLAALADEARLEQVLVNLLGNAIDAMASSPMRCLQVEAKVADLMPGHCLIRVSDTGPGIRADILAHLFEPFITSKPVGTGLGLGLMLSAHIVQEFGGSLRAFNLERAGACFEIDLPLNNPQEIKSNE